MVVYRAAVVVIEAGANVAFDRCRFTKNAVIVGSVLLISNSQSPVLLVDSIFDGNEASMDNGGAINLQQSEVILVYCSQNSYLFVI